MPLTSTRSGAYAVRPEIRRYKAVPREANQRQRRLSSGLTIPKSQRASQNIAHACLVLDHLRIAGFALLRKAIKSFSPINRRDHCAELV